MFYLLFQYKDGQEEKGFQKFNTKEELIAFLYKNINRFLIHIIIEPKKEYRFGLVEVAEKKGELTLYCEKCGDLISAQNTTGYCGKCASGSRILTSKKKCSDCGSIIAEWNKSGLCTKCRTANRLKLSKIKRREKREAQKLIEEKSLKKGKCRKCEKEFELEDWQHSSMHWCPECRKSGDYKEYNER